MGFAGRLRCVEVADESVRNVKPRQSAPVSRSTLLALGSALLLIVSFPSFNQPWCAWVALVPWLILLPGLTPRKAFGWSWLVGFAFFLGSIGWLTYVTFVGWIVLCAYLALFFGFFGVIANRLHTAHRAPYAPLLLSSSSWVALEFARSHLLTGFGWNLLAYSQAPYPAVIHMAQATGAWGVSFMVVLVNGLIAWWVLPARGYPQRLLRLLVTVAVALLPMAHLLHKKRLVKPRLGVAVTVVQGNIPQEEKWDEAREESILQRYEALTRKAAENPSDLIVWPETSVPGYVGIEEEVTQRLIRLAGEVGRPLLVGSPAPQWTPDGFSYVNRATLVDSSGDVSQVYDKLHLVPFGEFVPGDRKMPWLRKLLPPIGDFVPGKNYTVFTIPVPEFKSEMKFSVLICFEDLFGSLTREFVRRGAQALVVITNDAWFGPTAAAYQHAQASTLRAVELGVPVIRAANTGWSGFIDDSGRMTYLPVRDATGKELFVSGISRAVVGPATPAWQTAYVRYGDWFVWLCVLLLYGWSIIPSLYGSKRPSSK